MTMVAGIRQPAGTRRRRERGSQTLDIEARKMSRSGKGPKKGLIGGKNDVDISFDEDVLEAMEATDEVGKGGKGGVEGNEKGEGSEKGGGNGKDEEDDDDSTLVASSDQTLAPTFIKASPPTKVPSFPPSKGPSSEPTPGPTVSTDEPTTDPPTALPTEATGEPTIATGAPTESPSTTAPSLTSTILNALGDETAAPTIQPTKAPVTDAPTTTTAPFVASPDTEAPVTATPAPTQNTTGTGGEPVGIWDGDPEYYHRHLIPFAVSIEGNEVTNDLGITSCLLMEMQKNMTNLFNLDINNFTIVHFNDPDGDGYNCYDLYFAGFGELLGLPVYSQEFFNEVQRDAMGDGAEFFQNCLDDRFADSGQSYTASSLEHDQSSSGLDDNGIKAEDEIEDEDGELRTSLIIGLTVAAVVVALCGIMFASRVLKGDEDDGGAGRRK